MATYTTNYNLKKPAGTDLYSVGDFNDNADKVDAEMFRTEKALSRSNLLDNWYFPTAVNQRGQDYWSGYTGITVDRWKMTGTYGDVMWEEGSTITLIGGSSTEYVSLTQTLDEKTHALIKAEKFTVTVVCEDIDGTARLDYGGSIGDTTGSLALSNGINTFVFNGPTQAYPSSGTKPYIGVELSGVNKMLSVRAIKLELGETQTLAQMVNGSVVLNDAPNYGEQLLRCKRFYQVIENRLSLGVGAYTGSIQQGTAVYGVAVPVLLPVAMCTEINDLSVSLGSLGGNAKFIESSNEYRITAVSLTATSDYGQSTTTNRGSVVAFCTGSSITSALYSKLGAAGKIQFIFSTE